MFELAPIHRKGGAQVGWGAQCHCGHLDADFPDRKCKKQIDCGPGTPFTLEEGLVRIKMWCILGFEIDEDNPGARTLHVHKTRFKDETPWTMEELDDFVESDGD